MSNYARQLLPKPVKRFLRESLNRVQDSKVRRKTEQALAVASLTSPAQIFKSFSDDEWLWINTNGYRQISKLRQILPSLPADDIQFRFTGLAGDATLRDGFRIYKLFKEVIERHKGNLSDVENVLDFGCGWGRIIRFFLKDVEASGLAGIDCLDIAIDASHATNKWCDFSLINPAPPTSLPSDKFDIIYSYSVFSHLSEWVHLEWLAEFKRILKPGGLLIATTRRRDFIEYCAEVRQQPSIPVYMRGTASAFENMEQSLKDYDSGKFCYSPVGGGGALESSFFGETCIPEAYVAQEWTRYLEFVEFINDPALCAQNVIVARKH